MAGKGDNKSQKVVPIVLDGFEINAPNVAYQKLQEFSLILYEKLLNHRRERNFLLLDRDKLRTILENTRHEIKWAENIALNKDTELERTQERHNHEMKEVDQEVKYIMYNHKIDLSELQLWEENLTKEVASKNFSEELELLQEKRQLKEEVEQLENTLAEDLRNIKEQNEAELTNLKNKFEIKQIEDEIEFKRNLNETKEYMTLKHEMEMSEVEERKNTHLAELKLIHKTRLDEMKNFFNSITAENLTVISNLKQSLDVMKKSKSVMSEEIKQLKQENKKLQLPLTQSKAAVKNLTRQLINYEKDLLSLKNNKRMLKQTLLDTKQIKKQSNLAVRKIKSNNNEEFLNNIESRCLYSLTDFKNNAVLKRKQLEDSIVLLINELRAKQKIIKELTSDPDVSQAMSELHFEYWNPKKLYLELTLVCKAHDDLLETLREKLEEFCVPEQELHFQLLDTEHIGSSPAALVSKQ